MSTQKRKFQLFTRLQALGFTYEEAVALRRIEMTLQRWGERECGDGSDWCVERDENTGKPFNVYHGSGPRRRHPIADREAGALRRLTLIVAERNRTKYNLAKSSPSGVEAFENWGDFVFAYNQPDCRGCNLYLLTRKQLTGGAGELLPIDQYCTRGLAVCC